MACAKDSSHTRQIQDYMHKIPGRWIALPSCTREARAGFKIGRAYIAANALDFIHCRAASITCSMASCKKYNIQVLGAEIAYRLR